MLEEMYKPQQVVEVETAEISRDETTHPPFPALKPVISITDSTDGTGYEQISFHHGRSLSESTSRHKVLWSDDYDIPYGGRDLKGVVLPKKGEFLVETSAESGYLRRVRGFTDHHDFHFVVKASKVMRSLGLPTEVPYRASKLKEVVHQGKTMSMWQWKVRQVFKRLLDLKTLRYMAETDFLAIERHVQVPERVRDIFQTETIEELQELMVPVLGWLNTVFATNGELIKGKAEKITFEVEKVDTLKEYMTEWLPKQMGVYLGRLHREGLVHRATHDQNWSLVGTLYDLGEVRGKGVSDTQPTQMDINTDLKDTAITLTSLIRHLQKLGIEVSDSLVFTIFIKSYLEERSGVRSEDIIGLLTHYNLQELAKLI